MMENSKISWTDHTFNPWIGCEKVSAGCKNCYAFADAKWKHCFGPGSERHITSDNYWKQPLKWNKEAKEKGIQYRVFCGSYCDVFEDREDLVKAQFRLFGLIDRTPNLDWLLLTKRPQNIVATMPKNVWLGTSAEDQEMAIKRIPYLLRYSATVHFLSCEPLIGKVTLLDFQPFLYKTNPDSILAAKGILSGHINWVIIGGESGANRRPMELSWMQYLTNQCQKAGVPVFIKQDSAHKPGQQGRIPDELWNVKQYPTD